VTGKGEKLTLLLTLLVGWDKDLLKLQVRTTREQELIEALKDMVGVTYVWL